ncbi:MAG: hypothetical protein GY904_08415 [Planctomycetaceae bacterium]|nr:hypothetical protein [Planctomycetaceae bacterium]
MNVFTAANIRRMSKAALLDQHEEFDRIRVTSSNQARVDRAIEIMNLIAHESDRREFA